MKHFLKRGVFVAVFFSLCLPLSAEAGARQKTVAGTVHVPILLYHRFAPVASDSMTVTGTVFRSHLQYLKDNGFRVIPLRQLVDYYLRKGPSPSPGSVVIAVDDGHKSVYTEMLPLVKEYRVPVTLFIYPSAISNAAYAMTWDELRELRDTGLFDMQSHTFWHPNFKTEKKRRSAADYERFAEVQLKKSKNRIEKELAVKVDMLAWPFGICDDIVIKKAAEAGYSAAFTIERRRATEGDANMRLPRYLMQNSDRGKAFEMILGQPQGRKG